MAPTPTIFNYNQVQIHSGESKEDVDRSHYSTPTFRPPSAARRNIPSFATYSSTTSSTTPQHTSPLNFKGIPFSWEKIPGIPKYQESHKKSKSTRSLLPLPPAGNAISATATKTDPFLVALVECSKDDHGTDLGHFWKGSSKNFITRTLSDRFGFIRMYGSCKRGCGAVSESIVYLPRAATPPHYLFNCRPST